ncbi:type I restriction enzyme HsdR N-terminal domain-containing protein [Marinilabiliaceae bacterium JC017]|nr:type I restriction enzyme HsdR N-terminal domain-containing protein [Marinilabiliaceae bacterium JC017]
MQPLNLPTAQFRIKGEREKYQIFDMVRKKFVALTPEEWVRQHFINYLLVHLKYPRGLISVEMPVTINGLKQRADIVLFNRKGQPMMVVECKAPSVNITRRVFDQAARYNMRLQTSLLVVTNGLQHYCAALDAAKEDYSMLKQIPTFEQALSFH